MEKKKKEKKKRTEECDFGKCWQIVECCSYAIVKSLLGEEEKKGGVQKSEGGGAVAVFVNVFFKTPKQKRKE